MLLGAGCNEGVRTESLNMTIYNPIMPKVSANGCVKYQQIAANYTFSVVNGF